MLALVSSGCGEMGPLKDSSYTASSAAQQAPFARLNASHPRASPKAWCRDQEDVNGYLQVNLGRRWYKINECMKKLIMNQPIHPHLASKSKLTTNQSIHQWRNIFKRVIRKNISKIFFHAKPEHTFIREYYNLNRFHNRELLTPSVHRITSNAPNNSEIVTFSIAIPL